MARNDALDDALDADPAIAIGLRRWRRSTSSSPSSTFQTVEQRSSRLPPEVTEVVSCLITLSCSYLSAHYVYLRLHQRTVRDGSVQGRMLLVNQVSLSLRDPLHHHAFKMFSCSKRALRALLR